MTIQWGEGVVFIFLTKKCCWVIWIYIGKTEDKQTAKQKTNNQTKNLHCITQKDELKIDHKHKYKTNPLKFSKKIYEKIFMIF